MQSACARKPVPLKSASTAEFSAVLVEISAVLADFCPCGREIFRVCSGDVWSTKKGKAVRFALSLYEMCEIVLCKAGLLHAAGEFGKSSGEFG